MLKLLISILLVNIFLNGLAQTSDSSIQSSIKLELVGDPPYPRIDQPYTVGVKFSGLLDSLYYSYLRMYPSTRAIPFIFEHGSCFTLDSLKKGVHEIGPLNFSYNNLNFTTNKLIFYVDDTFPLTNNGISIRYIMTSDSTFCLSIEQRTPVHRSEDETREQLIRKHSNECLKMARVELQTGDWELLEYTTSDNGCSLKDLMINNKQEYFFSYFNNTCFHIKLRNRPIKLVKSNFVNLPVNYHYEPIIIRK